MYIFKNHRHVLTSRREANDIYSKTLVRKAILMEAAGPSFCEWEKPRRKA